MKAHIREGMFIFMCWLSLMLGCILAGVVMGYLQHRYSSTTCTVLELIGLCKL